MLFPQTSENLQHVSKTISLKKKKKWYLLQPRPIELVPLSLQLSKSGGRDEEAWGQTGAHRTQRMAAEIEVVAAFWYLGPPLGLHLLFSALSACHLKNQKLVKNRILAFTSQWNGFVGGVKQAAPVYDAEQRRLLTVQTEKWSGTEARA